MARSGASLIVAGHRTRGCYRTPSRHPLAACVEGKCILPTIPRVRCGMPCGKDQRQRQIGGPNNEVRRISIRREPRLAALTDVRQCERLPLGWQRTLFGTRGSQVQILPLRPSLNKNLDGLRQWMRQSFAGRKKNRGKIIPTPIDKEFLRRDLSRRTEPVLVRAAKATNRIRGEMSLRGALPSTRASLAVNEEMHSVYTEAMSSAATFLFNASNGQTIECTQILDQHGRELAERIVASLMPTSGDDAFGFAKEQRQITGKLEQELAAIRETIVDGFSHGMLGDAKLTKDPAIQVISSITNSPGATQQSGVGSLQQQVNQEQVNPLIAKIEELVRSPEFQALDSPKKDALRDVAEVLTNELQRPQPEPGKVRR